MGGRRALGLGRRGAGSVLGSVSAMLALWGFSTVLLGGAAVYAVAFALLAGAHARRGALGAAD